MSSVYEREIRENGSTSAMRRCCVFNCVSPRVLKASCSCGCDGTDVQPEAAALLQPQSPSAG